MRGCQLYCQSIWIQFDFHSCSAMTDNTISSFSFHIKAFVKYLARVATHKHVYVYTYFTDTPAHAHKSIVATISPKAIFIDKKKRHARNFFSCSITYMDCTVSKSKCGILPHSSTILCSRKRYKDRSGFPHSASSCVNSNRNKNIQVKYSWINSAIIVDSCFIYSPHDFIALPFSITNPENNAAWPLTKLSLIISISTNFYFSYIWNRLRCMNHTLLLLTLTQNEIF